MAIATPAEGPSLGTAPAGTWTWMSCVGEPVVGRARERARCACAAHPGERRLGRLPHHVAELAGDRQLARAGHRGRLDEEHLAADRRPGEAGGDARVLGAAALSRRRSGACRAARGRAWRRSCTLPLALPSATSRATLRQIVPIWRSRLRTPGLARVLLDDRRQRRVGELDLGGLQPVGRELARRPGSAWRCGASRRSCSRRARSPPSGPGAAAGSCRGCSRWR